MRELKKLSVRTVFISLFYLRSGRWRGTSTSSLSSAISPLLRTRVWSFRRSLTGSSVCRPAPSPARRCWSGWGETARRRTRTPSWAWSCPARRTPRPPPAAPCCPTRSTPAGQTRPGNWKYWYFSAAATSVLFQLQLHRLHLLRHLLGPPVAGVARAGQQVVLLLLHQTSAAAQETTDSEAGGEVPWWRQQQWHRPEFSQQHSGGPVPAGHSGLDVPASYYISQVN